MTKLTPYTLANAAVLTPGQYTESSGIPADTLLTRRHEE
jgi:hypothetical protein